jgi:hypothetical protein
VNDGRGKDGLHLRKRRQIGPLLSHRPFSGQPDIFHRILCRGVRRKLDQLDLPLRFRTIGALQGRQIVLDEMRRMIAGAIPQNDESPSLEDLAKIRQKGHRILFVARRGLPQNHPARQEIQGPIIGLPYPNIRDGDGQPFMAGPPAIAPRIPPHEMTFIHRQGDGLLEDQGGGFRQRFFLIASRLAATFCGSALGWRSWDFFQDMPAAFKSA